MLTQTLSRARAVGGRRSRLARSTYAQGRHALELEKFRRAALPTPESYRENELIGDPDWVFETLAPALTSLGVTELVVNGPASGLDWRGEGYESMKLFAEEVLPRLQAL